MSPILTYSAEELMQPGFVSRAAMVRLEIPVLTPTFLLISGRPERGQQILP
jgi:hypothetical protein